MLEKSILLVPTTKVYSLRIFQKKQRAVSIGYNKSNTLDLRDLQKHFIVKINITFSLSHRLSCKLKKRKGDFFERKTKN